MTCPACDDGIAAIGKWFIIVAIIVLALTCFCRRVQEDNLLCATSTKPQHERLGEQMEGGQSESDVS